MKGAHVALHDIILRDVEGEKRFFSSSVMIGGDRSMLVWPKITLGHRGMAWEGRTEARARLQDCKRN